MVTILPPVDKSPSFGQRLSAGVGRGLEIGSQMMQQRQQQQALQQMGIDPAVLSLPEQGQAAYFKSKFPVEKPMTPLQQAQQRLAEQKANQAESTGSFFNRLMQGQQPTPTQEGQALAGSPQGGFSLETLPEDKLRQLASFAGQPGEAGIIGNMAKNEQEERKSKKSQEFESKKLFHSETKKYDESLKSKAETAEIKNRAIDRMIPNIDKVGVWDRFVSNVLSGTPWENVLKSSTAQEFDSNSLPLLEGLRQTLGGVLSDSDIRLIMQKIVTASKTPEANKKIAKALKLENNIAIARDQIGDEIKQENNGFRPPNYAAHINERLKGRYGYDVGRAFEDLVNLPDDPKKLKQITGRTKVEPGTPLSPEIIDFYLDKSANNPELAKRMAKEDGYTIP